MDEPGPLERLLRRDRLITAVALLILCAGAWIYVIAGAGLGPPAWRMSNFGLPSVLADAGVPGAAEMPAMAEMPGMPDAPSGTGAHGQAARTLLIAAMWWSMMVAMMAPSAAPMVLLYARVARTTQASSAAPTPALRPTGWFVVGYLAVWLGFSVAAALLQLAFERQDWISPDLMSAQNRRFAAAVLVLAGLYQLTPVQDLCLRHCRSPAVFLSRRYRPGRLGALQLGLVHGIYCLGCCWLLMALLFVAGVMNLVWIAALTLLVVAQKVLPGGRWIGRIAGLALIVAGISVLA